MRERLIRFARAALPTRVQTALSKLAASDMYARIAHLRQLGYAPAVVLDVGAFEGEWTRNVVPVFPDATFVMFEPQEAKRAALESVCREHANVRIVATLLGKQQADAVTFFEMETGSSIYEEQTSHSRHVRTYPMRTLDDAMHALDLSGEVFLKLDVQGAELDVLAGATETLARCSFVLLETSVLSFNRGAPLFDAVIAYMRARGFVVFDVCELRRKDNGTLFQLDVMFSRADGAIRRAEDNFP